VLVHGPKLADRLVALVRHLLVGHTNLAVAMQVDFIGLAARPKRRLVATGSVMSW
jgi:hypothetical protein